MIASAFRRLPAILRNAVVWGIGWGVLGFAVIAMLRLVGVGPKDPWLAYFGLAARFAIIGTIAGAAFSTIIRVFYRGRRLVEINWIRFGIVGGIVTGLFVPTFLQFMNVVTGDGMVPMRLVTDDAVLGFVFGAIVADGSMKLAQRAASRTASST